MIHLAGPLAVLLSFLTHPTATVAGDLSTDSLAQVQSFLAREWRWAEDDGLTVLTVQGPAGQVAAFEPGDPLSECPDCLLMSSVAFGEPDGSVALSIDPDQPPATPADPSR